MKIIKDSPKKKAYKQKIVNKEVGMKDNIIKDKYELMDNGELLTKEELEELKKIMDEINEEAKKVVKDYENEPSENSGSVIHVHHNSPILDND